MIQTMRFLMKSSDESHDQQQILNEERVMHFDLEKFEFDEKWLRQAAAIEEAANCDIEAGFSRENSGGVTPPLDQTNELPAQHTTLEARRPSDSRL